MADEDTIQLFSSGVWSSLGYPTGAEGGQTTSDYLQQSELLTSPLPSVFSPYFEYSQKGHILGRTHLETLMNYYLDCFVWGVFFAFQ